MRARSAHRSRPHARWIDAFCDELAAHPRAAHAASHLGGVYRFVVHSDDHPPMPLEVAITRLAKTIDREVRLPRGDAVLVVAVTLLIGNAAIWVDRSLADRDEFVETASDELDDLESRQELAEQIVFALMGNQPLVYQIAGPTAEQAVTRREIVIVR